MKNLAVALLVLSLTLVSCGKGGNKNVIKTDGDGTVLADNGKVDENISYNAGADGKKIIRTNYQYKAADGSPVTVTFDYEPGTSDVEISSNGKMFKLDKVKSDGKVTTYEKGDMRAVVKGDSLILHQGTNIIELVKGKI
ncbi:hypothetical protein ASG31_00870 [Chryseobacterium sp. Leaf404]|uniref:hypothetical protein n=1 Tax=unclassified Chryseobacterium TaxID=2593645 RepID=UPI0006F73569|nr:MULTISPECIES: hypothetical protein [unclassified Chryseobacterium]KQT21928.1 hypothetical protein ASG31_00870 [Chryseobacterium sp. Leaf404]